MQQEVVEMASLEWQELSELVVGRWWGSRTVGSWIRSWWRQESDLYGMEL